MLQYTLGRLAAAVTVAGAAIAGGAATASASTAAPDGVRAHDTSSAPNAVSEGAGTAVENTVLEGTAVEGTVLDGTVTLGGTAIVRPFTGTGCHTYDFWSGAQVCITVYGAGLHVNAVSGETDAPDSDWGQLWDTDGVVNIWGHPTNHYLTVDWSSGGGIWLPQNDNFCFTDTTINQTACLLIHS